MGALRLTVARWRLSGHAFDLQRETRALRTTVEGLLRPQAPAAGADAAGGEWSRRFADARSGFAYGH